MIALLLLVLCFFSFSNFSFRRTINQQRRKIATLEWGLRLKDEYIRALEAGKKVFRCPRCGKVSYHPMDRKEGWCGSCHAFTAPGQAEPAGVSEGTDAVRPG